MAFRPVWGVGGLAGRGRRRGARSPISRFGVTRWDADSGENAPIWTISGDFGPGFSVILGYLAAKSLLFQPDLAGVEPPTRLVHGPVLKPTDHQMDRLMDRADGPAKLY